MGFYYFSFFSVLPLAVAYGVLSLVFVGIVWITRRIPGRIALLSAVGVLLLPLPVAEELWIAWHFGQACKNAGTFIYRKVEADGFYDATMRSGYENTKAGRYRFIEQKTADHKGFERVERANDQAKAAALTWYANRNPGKERPKDQAIEFPVSEQERIVVFPNGVDAWLVTTLARPVARYHYSWPNRDVLVSHKVYKHDEEVRDMVTGIVLARSLSLGRRAPWFFLALDAPGMSCPTPRNKPGVLLYRVVLDPPKG